MAASASPPSAAACGRPVTGIHRTWIHEALRLLARARGTGESRTDGEPDAEAPETLPAATVRSIEGLFGTGIRHGQLSRRAGALWGTLLPALVPPGHETRYLAGPPRLPSASALARPASSAA
ncbi:hypothetical protein [Streptomyces akebiae]|uniref:Uncharacterized protein n=1 Tax=Streptomyces akebiae TaxID=2865673 RepID=A0ABX8Y6Y2_9ACTN|nr:hypothetical protein [Streptomyces akebiae]QYX83583.1 hypothetical protein K1J60_44805 [Streptomyces akebiae]